MENNIYKSIVQHLPIGYLYSRIIYDKKDNPRDYEIIEVNKSFEYIVNIEEKDLIGKKFSQLYETSSKNQSTWDNFHSIIDHSFDGKDSEYYFDFIDKYYRVKCQSPTEGYIVIYLTDITGEIREKEQNDLKERILYSSMEFTQELLTNDDLYSALSNGIEMLGNATQVDRVYYWENHYDKDSKKWTTSQKFEWCLEDVDQQIYNPGLQRVPFEEIGSFIEKLSQNKTFSCHVKDMNDDNEYDKMTKENFQAQGILSMLVLPVFIKDEFRGFIGFDSCKTEKEWSQVEISLLNSFVFLYVKAIERNSLESSIIQEKENFNNFFSMIQDLLFVLDFEGKIIQVNNSVLDRSEYSRKELLGKPVLMLHPKDKREEVKKNIEDLIAKKIDVCNIQAITKSGEVFPVETKVSQGLWNGEKAIFAVSKDITDLSMSEEKFSKAFNNSGISMFISKLDNGEILEVNDRFLEFMGYKRDEVIGKTTLDLRVIENYISREKLIKEISTHGKISDREIKILAKDHRVSTGLVNVVPLNINNEMCLLSSIIDITDRIKYEEKILELSNRDSLTGLYNRRYVYERAEEIIEEYKRNKKIFSVAIIDIDDFKEINDTYGHQIGDCVLKEFANILDGHLRPYDILGRFGGEEFIIILNHSNLEESNSVLERILNIIINKTFVFEGNLIKFSFSAGISSCEELEKGQIDINKLVGLADKRMYIAKNSGKNEIVYK